MGRLRFIPLSGLLLVLFMSLSLIATVLFIDAADFVSDWSPAEQAQRLTEMSLIATAIITPLALILFAKRLLALGWSGWCSLPISGLIFGSFLVEWALPDDARTAWVWLLFAAAFIGLIFGDLRFGITQRKADA